MMILPAVDIRGGKCVRLTQGDFKQEVVYSDFPEDQALKWQEEGARFLHVVDLDGAREGHLKNIFSIKKVLDAVRIPIQAGGGVRTMNDIEALLDMGVNRVIVGSMAVENPAFIREAASTFGGENIVVGIDAREGVVAVHGWGDSGYMRAEELAMEIGDYGISTMIYTDIARDGTLAGVEAKKFADIAEKSGISLIASGGVSSLDDIRELKKYEHSGVVGVIVGKALYERKINLADAVEIAE